MSKDVLVIQVLKNLTHYDLQSFQKDLCKMKESGVVVLPNWCELVEVTDGSVDIEARNSEIKIRYPYLKSKKKK